MYFLVSVYDGGRIRPCCGTEDENEDWQEEPPDPGEIVFSAESFEAFMCRFWLENEIWFAAHEETPMPAACQEYIEQYRRKTN
jgi:hypothetical protein